MNSERLSETCMITYRYHWGTDGIETVYALPQDCLTVAASLAQMGAITILVGPARNTSASWWWHRS